ncbi:MULTISPECIES: FAD-dependent oxidoreductase [Streptomyces]|uniref:FAD-dependent monooxygenase n=1 Tax=Streptomyces evansiae TaxID=3075535 RepID=A0ABU2QYS0_9ACTN|nr:MULTISPECIES: FAD-dependent oxidoreductase [unclassified Streptomyces]MDT0409599.1 FAD-dependent monooxygenase [Streptomyces sp. DSM 41979]MYQ57047.1 polyketide oxidase [Streptomyces sp. SID4926]SCD90541.1 2-polyprenyl-6-methoxyphenol hydroxylase [Streptomyces sp. DfronAA-171]
MTHRAAGPAAEPVTCEVVIVGGGPVGMLLAHELALQGVPPLVLEKLPTPSGVSKAGTLHARTVESLHRRGLREAVQPRPARGGQPSVPFHFAAMFDLDFAEVSGEGPVMVGSPQAYAEQVFAERAAALGARIVRGAECTGIEQEEDRVTVEVRDTSGTRHEVTTHWVVACDGVRSAVRRSAGIPFTGTPATVSALMGEVRLLDPWNAPTGWQRTPRGWTLVWLNPAGHSRVCTYDFRGPEQDRQAEVTFEELRAETERIAGHAVPMAEPRDLTRFSDAALQAERYRRGRVLVAGDAAHAHFPMGGQGLNTGLQDALNLGWKLAAEVQGWAPPGLLETYHTERHPAGARVLHNVRAQVALMNPQVLTTSLRELFREMMHLPQVNRFLSGMISATDTRYDVGVPGDRLAGAFAPDLPLDNAKGPTSLAALMTDGRPLLLHSAEAAEAAEVLKGWTDRVRVVEVHAKGPAPLPAPALLIRPDGYVLWSDPGGAERVPTLTAVAEAWFGTPA